MHKKINYILIVLFALILVPLFAVQVENPSFEQGESFPGHWERYGDGEYFWHGDDAHTGYKCLNLGGDHSASVYQRIPAGAGKEYQLRAWIKHFSRDGQENRAQIKLEFHNEQERKISEKILEVEAPGEWEEFSLSDQAPSGTAFVTVTLLSYAGSMVMFDDVSLDSEETVTYDLNKVSHDFLGFGTQAWAYKENPHNQDHADARFAALADMNIQFIRIENYTDQADWNEMRALREQTNALGIKWVYTMWRWKEGAKKIENEEQVAAFAREWRDVVNQLYTEGIDIEYIELMNEPNSKGDWSTGMDPYWFSRVVAQVRQELENSGLDHVGIIGPGLSSMSYSDQAAYIDYLPDDSLFAWSVHPWGDEENGPYSFGVRNLEHWWETTFGGVIKKKNSKLPIFVTEFSSKAGISHGDADLVGGWDENKVVPNYCMSNTIPFAIHSYQNALTFLNMGANSAFFWQLNDEWPEARDKDKAWGFLDLWGKPKPVYEAMRTLAAKIPVGSKVLEAPSQKGHTLYTGAFVHEGEIIVGVANTHSFEQKTTLRFSNTSKKLSVKEATAYTQTDQGDQSKGIPDKGEVSEKDLVLKEEKEGIYSFEVTLPANSVLTVVLN